MTPEAAAPSPPRRVLELYCGIGGCAAALDGFPGAEMAAGVDLNRRALAVMHLNFAHPAVPLQIGFIPVARLAAWRADLWWLSPPCQPFTRRGRGRDDADPRTRSLLGIMDRLGEVRPRRVALENVPEMQGSRTHARLMAVLAAAGYEVAETVLCPSELGVPNRRRRYYLLASLDGVGDLPSPAREHRPLHGYLDPHADGDRSLEVPLAIVRRYAHAIDVVDAEDPAALTATFTAAYGRSPVRSGSYLRTSGGQVRYFTPAEILRLLGFPCSFRLPPDVSRAQAYRLVGNSLSIEPARRVLAALL